MAAPASAKVAVSQDYQTFVAFCESQNLTPAVVKQRATSQVSQLKEVANELQAGNPAAAAAKREAAEEIEAYVKKLDSMNLPAAAKKVDGAAAASMGK